MADNTSITPGVGAKVATDEVTYSGETASVQLVRLVDVSGVEGSKTVGALTLPVSIAASVAVTGTFWQATQPVSGTITANAGTGTMAVSAAALPLPTGASTAANQTALNALFPATLGQKAMAASLAVVIASDQSAVPASQSGTWSITNVSGTISLPTGAATSANQSTLNTNIGSSADAVVANGVAGSIASYLRTIKDQATSTASSAVTIDQTTPGTTDAVTVKSPADVISFTPTLDTAVYAAGDVLFATAAISGVTRANDLRSALMSLTAIDKSKNKPAFTLFFFQTNVTSAAANAANALSDADAVNCLGFVRVLSTDWIDLANNSFACFKGINLLLEAATGTTTVYVVGILDAGTPTFAVGDLVLKLGVVQS